MAHTGAMIALVPTVEDATRLAVDGGEDADQLHVTLMYLGEAAMLPSEVCDSLVRAVERVTAELPTVTGKIFSVNVFNPTPGGSIVAAGGSEPCVTWSLEGELLTNAHKLVTPTVREVFASYMLEPHQQHDPWIPHITAAYIADDDEVDLTPFTNMLGPVTFDRVRLAFGDNVVDIPLGNNAINYDHESAVTATFDPNQPRDADGQWTDEPSSGLGTLKKIFTQDTFNSIKPFDVVIVSTDKKMIASANSNGELTFRRREANGKLSITPVRDAVHFHELLAENPGDWKLDKKYALKGGISPNTVISVKKTDSVPAAPVSKSTPKVPTTKTPEVETPEVKVPEAKTPKVVTPKKPATTPTPKTGKSSPEQDATSVSSPLAKSSPDGAPGYAALTPGTAQAMQQRLHSPTRWTLKQRQAVEQYTDNSYVRLNGYLRGDPRYTTNAAQTRKDIATLASIMRPSIENMTVFRSVHVDTFGLDTVGELSSLVGSSGTTKGFSSTKLTRDKGHGVYCDTCAMLNIRVPKGTKMAYVASQSTNPHEQELILAHGLKYRILSAEPPTEKGRPWQVVMEVISE